ncbi:MAG: hypothetical protein R3F11_15175 [Verrucomicrobiales bacterium]
MPAIDRPTCPTMYFLGVTTGRSSINRIFPPWAAALGLGEARLCGLDFAVRDDPARFRAAVEFIKAEPLARGALITTHKMDVFAACRDLIDEIDPLAESMAEVSSLYKRGGKLCGRTSDPQAGGAALNAFLPAGHWSQTGAQACLLGAGGSSLALSWHLLADAPPGDRPARLIVTDRSPDRLAHLRAFHQKAGAAARVEYRHIAGAADNDAAVAALPPGSLVVNATGLGKDAPGSPLTDAAAFPDGGYIWEFNYRGDLVFLDQANAQRAARRLTVEDGWRYFVIGWTSVIADVFGIDPPTGDRFAEISRLAADAR